MATLIRPRSWGNQKPVLGSTINWGHPLAQGLTELWLFNEQGGRRVFSLTSGASGVLSDASGDARHPLGITIGTAIGTADSGAGFYVPIVSRTYSQITFLVRADARSLSDTSSSHAPMFSRAANSGSSTGGISMGANGVLGYTWDDASNTWGWSTGPALPTRGVFNMAVSIHPGMALAMAGARSAVNSVSHGSASYGGRVYFGKDPFTGSSPRGFPGNYVLAAIWSRALSESELLWLEAEPYAFLNPPGPKASYFSLSSGGGATTTTAAVSLYPLGVGRGMRFASSRHGVRRTQLVPSAD